MEYYYYYYILLLLGDVGDGGGGIIVIEAPFSPRSAKLCLLFYEPIH
jgi:hypothetical protein